jgi:hypothetical protein
MKWRDGEFFGQLACHVVHKKGIDFDNRRINMELREYFENLKGNGVLATADDQGHVDVAVYSKPHIMDDETIAFIMPDRLTHHNLQSNNHAAYLFKEEGPGYKGIRFFLTKLREEKDSELLHSIRRKSYPNEKGEEDSRFLVFFKVDKVLPLIGAGKDS